VQNKRNNWGLSCCIPVVIADFTCHAKHKYSLRHMGRKCLGHQQGISHAELMKGKVAAQT
jgi:hypothetical protein